MNKHGFTGVRKRTDGRARPYYARLTVNGKYVYTDSHETAKAAAKAFQLMRSGKRCTVTKLNNEEK